MISATIITFNEEENIRQVLKSLQGVVDEVVIVDSGSSDNTVKIAKKMGAKVSIRKFDDFSTQKNWAVAQTSGDWILSLDADERIPEVLGEEIKKAVEKDYAGFLIPRRNFILGQEIKHSRWSPDKHIWLWKKDCGRWEGAVHEEVVVNGKVGELKTAKVNYQDKTIARFMSKNDFYSTIYANYLFKQGTRFSYFHLFFDPFYEFILRYFYKLGFLDGMRGFILCYLMAIYKISIWIKIHEAQYLKR